MRTITLVRSCSDPTTGEQPHVSSFLMGWKTRKSPRHAPARPTSVLSQPVVVLARFQRPTGAGATSRAIARSWLRPCRPTTKILFEAQDAQVQVHPLPAAASIGTGECQSSSCFLSTHVGAPFGATFFCRSSASRIDRAGNSHRLDGPIWRASSALALCCRRRRRC